MNVSLYEPRECFDSKCFDFIFRFIFHKPKFYGDNSMTKIVCKEIYTNKPWSYVSHATRYVNRIFGGTSFFKGCGPGYVAFGLKKLLKDFTFNFQYAVSYEEKKTTITFMNEKGTLVITFEDAGNGMARTCASWSGAHEFLFKGELKQFVDEFSKALVDLCKDSRYCFDPSEKKPREFEEIITMNSIVFILRSVMWPDAVVTGEEIDGERKFEARIKAGILEEFKFCTSRGSCTDMVLGIPIDALDYTPFEDLGLDGKYKVFIKPIESGKTIEEQ